MSDIEFMPLMCGRRRVVVRSKGVEPEVDDRWLEEMLRVRRRLVARGT